MSARSISVDGGWATIGGLDNDGRPAPWRIPMPGYGYFHWLLSGMSGSGKSNTLNAIFYALAGQDDVAVCGVDMKFGMELAPWSDRFTTIAETPTEASRLIAILSMEVERRGQLMKQLGIRKWDPERCGGPWIVVPIDEFAELSMNDRVTVFQAILGAEDAGKGLKADDQQIKLRFKTVQSLAQVARAAGVFLTLAAQYPTTAVVPTAIRTNIPGAIVHRMRSQIETGVAFGDEGMAASVEPITEQDHVGTCYVTGIDRERGPDGDVLYPADPLKARAFFVSDADVARRVAETRGFRWDWDDLFGKLDLSLLEPAEAA